MAVKRIDIHSHVIPGTMIDEIAAHPDKYSMHVEGEGAGMRIVRAGHGAPVYAEFHDPEAKIESMDRRGIDISVISPAPIMFFYWLDADVALRLSRLVNDGIAAMAAARPDRLRGAATLPMQDPDAAVAELERVVKTHGFRAVEIGSLIEGKQLADPRFRPVLRRAHELDVFIFTHPYHLGPKPGLECYYTTNFIGNPLDTAIMATHLIFSGALDELPRLKICLPHAGGYLPYQIGRLVHGQKVRKEARVHTTTPPLELFRRFYFDTLAHSPQALRYLIDLVGADHIAIGTDAPYDMGDEAPLALLDAVPGLTAAERDQICGLTALKLLGEERK
ncbi:MAG TPA: amidohydrolase family protein [Burkholderiales bacterium]|nr:amidohydrolase family protein [Burkholderiales bacterium]